VKTHLSPVQKLRAEVEPLVPSDEKLLGAFKVLTGPTPGTEAWPMPLQVLGLGVTLVKVVFRRTPPSRLWESSRYFTVVVTDTSVLVLADTRLQPNELVERHPGHDSVGPLRGEGDKWVDIAGARYWIQIYWTDELRRLERLVGTEPA
jgi:hypothetical protein